MVATRIHQGVLYLNNEKKTLLYMKKWYVAKYDVLSYQKTYKEEINTYLLNNFSTGKKV